MSTLNEVNAMTSICSLTRIKDTQHSTHSHDIIFPYPLAMSFSQRHTQGILCETFTFYKFPMCVHILYVSHLMPTSIESYTQAHTHSN